jgi:hypothetical protein
VKELVQSVSSQYLYDVGGYDFQCKNGIDKSLLLEILIIRGATISYPSYKKKEKDNKENNFWMILRLCSQIEEGETL